MAGQLGASLPLPGFGSHGDGSRRSPCRRDCPGQPIRFYRRNQIAEFNISALIGHPYMIGGITQGCPARYAAGIFGDKWCFLILRDVLLHGKRTYSDFLNSPEGISTNILADRLSRLEAAAMLDRQIDPRKASRVCYFPTRKARDVLPALISMMVWSTQYDECTDAPNSFAKAYQSDASKTIARYEVEFDRVDAEIFEAP